MAHEVSCGVIEVIIAQKLLVRRKSNTIDGRFVHDQLCCAQSLRTHFGEPKSSKGKEGAVAIM